MNLLPESDSQSDIDAAALLAASRIAEESPDPSTKVGALFLSSDNLTVLGAGHNRFPDGMDHSPERYADRAFKYKHIRHAEIWALRSVISHFAPEDFRHLLSGSTLYTSFNCCENCARAVAPLGIRRVVFPGLNRRGRSEDWLRQWEGDAERAVRVFEHHGVEVSRLHV